MQTANPSEWIPVPYEKLIKEKLDVIRLILGILGIYIAKIYKEVQARPKFIIKE